MDFELIAGVSAIFVIMAVIEIFKSFGLNQKYSPIFAVILGLVFSFAMAFYGNTVEYESAIKD